MSKRIMALAIITLYAGVQAAARPQSATSILPHVLAKMLVDFNIANITDHGLQERSHALCLQHVMEQEASHASIRSDLANQAPVALPAPCLEHKNHIKALKEKLVLVNNQTYTTPSLNRLKGEVIAAITKNITINTAIYRDKQRAVAHNELRKEVDLLQTRYSDILKVFKEKHIFSDTEWTAYVATLAQEQAQFASTVEIDLHCLTQRIKIANKAEVPTSNDLTNILTNAAELTELLQNLQAETSKISTPAAVAATK